MDRQQIVKCGKCNAEIARIAPTSQVVTEARAPAEATRTQAVCPGCGTTVNMPVMGRGR